MTDFNVKVSVRNARLLKAIRERYASVSEMARHNGISASLIGEYLNLKKSPLKSGNVWRENALTIASAVGYDPEDLWPDHIASVKISRSSAEFECSLSDVQALTDGSAERRVIQRNAIAYMAQTLSPREISIIGAYQKGATLEELAHEHGVTRERIRQIMLKGFRKMRVRAGHRNITPETLELRED